MKKWLYALVGVISMLVAGFVYAWSILSSPIAADFPAWSNAQLSLTFTLCMIFFCLGGMGAGMLAKKQPVRVNLRISAVLFLCAFVLTSRTKSLAVLYFGYGVLGGSASGFAYNSLMNAIPRWFPDQPGLISGILLMGFGASSMVIGSLFTAVTPDGPGAWRQTLLLFGVVMAVLLGAASFVIRPPRAGEVASSAAGGAGKGSGRELTPAQMAGQSGFWFFFAWAVLTSAVGLIVISQARNVARAAAGSITPGTLSLVVGLISICNGVGRVIFGGLYDRLREKTLWLVIGCDALGVALLMLSLRGSLVLLVAAFIVIGLGYGGTPPLNAAVIKDFYGTENYPVNFSLINMNLLVASFSSTLSGAIYDAAGSFTPVLLLLFGALALSAACCALVRRPQ